MSTSVSQLSTPDSFDILAGGTVLTAKPYVDGGGKSVVIADGRVFEGRVQGGGSRSHIFGSRDYGSGYPNGGILRGTEGRGFPFYFWPVMWASPFIVHANDAYLHPVEYGLPGNQTRPGGGLTTLTYISNLPSASTFRILTDGASASSLLSSLTVCNPWIYLSSTSPDPYLSGAVIPLPEQAVQYYRASSAVLILDNYNNTAALLPQDSNPVNVLLPGGTDIDLLACLNTTIGAALLLVDTSASNNGLSSAAIFGIIIASVVTAMLLLCIIGAMVSGCRRRSSRRTPPVSRLRTAVRPASYMPGSGEGLPPSPPFGADIKEPPKVLVAPVTPPVGRRRDSSGASMDSEDSAGLVRNAQEFAGTEGDEYPRGRPGQTTTPWWVWKQRGERENKGFENIELGKGPYNY